MTAKDETIHAQAETIARLTKMLEGLSESLEHIDQTARRATENYDNLLKASIADKAKVKELERELADLKTKDDSQKMADALRRVQPSDFSIKTYNPML